LASAALAFFFSALTAPLRLRESATLFAPPSPASSPLATVAPMAASSADFIALVKQPVTPSGRASAERELVGREAVESNAGPPQQHVT
jgi:hypothetical protein